MALPSSLQGGSGRVVEWGGGGETTSPSHSKCVPENNIMPISEERGGGHDYSKVWPPWIIITDKII